jgi:hypothetical protein
VSVDVREVHARAADAIDPRIGIDRLAWMAAAAGPESGALCVVSRVEEGYTIAARLPARTARTAIDPALRSRVATAFQRVASMDCMAG